jgi:hypothetical protein
MGKKAVLSCMSQTLGCEIDPFVLCDDAVLQAVVEFGATVYGNVRSTGGMNGCDEFVGGVLHHFDSSKVRLQRRTSAGDNTKVAAIMRVFAHAEDGLPLQMLFGRAYIPAWMRLCLQAGRS